MTFTLSSLLPLLIRAAKIISETRSVCLVLYVCSPRFCYRSNAEPLALAPIPCEAPTPERGYSGKDNGQCC